MKLIKTFKNAFHYLRLLLIREKDYYLCRPVVLMMFLTYRCTSKCQSCNMWTRQTNDRELTLEEWKKVVDNLSNKSEVKAEIFGGDQLLRPDVLISLIKYIKEVGISYIDMPTNCNLLDQKMAQDLVESGLDLLYVSLDSVDNEQDEIRGMSDSFTKIKNAVTYLRQARGLGKTPKICTNTTVSNLNYDSLERVIKASVELGMDEIAIGYVGEFNIETIEATSIDGIKPNPYFIPQKNSLRVNPKQAKSLKENLRKIKQQADNLKFYVASKNIDILTMENMVTGKFPFKKCYVCRTQVSIDPYGNVAPCPFYPDYILGNLTEKPLREIWNNKKHKRFIKIVDRNQLPICSECVLTMERNVTFWQAFRQIYLVFTKKGNDEPEEC